MAETSRVVRCSNCRAVLVEGVGVIVPTISCSACGSTARLVQVARESNLAITSRLAAHKRPEDGGPTGEAIRVSGPGQRTASGDLPSLTSATYDISGPAPKGEDGRLETASLLVQNLRKLGEVWEEPQEVDDRDIDCRATRDHETLDIQVTRAAGAVLFQTLHHAGHASAGGSADDLADALLEVIRRKARLPPLQLRDLVLAIDARDTPAFAMAGIVMSFRLRHVPEAAQFGFRSIWVVGPTVRLVERLDA